MYRAFFMDIEIRKIAESDLPTVFDLMTEFAEFEQLSANLEIKPSSYVDAMFGPNAFVEGLIALEGTEALGYALFYPCFATFRSLPGMFLEDLFVSEKARGKGIGDMLLRKVAKIAKDRGLQRIDLHVLEWNKAAIEFYKNRGADVDNDDRHLRFVDKAFAKLAE